MVDAGPGRGWWIVSVVLAVAGCGGGGTAAPEYDYGGGAGPDDVPYEYGAAADVVADTPEPGPEVEAPPAPADPCDPLPDPVEPIVHVSPADADALRQLVMDADPGTTFLLADGTYDLSGGDAEHRLSVRADGVTLRSASGDRDAVVLDGGWGTNHVLDVQASDVTIASLTVARAIHHPIHATGASDRTITNLLLHDIVVRDPGQQAIKINANGGQQYFVDDGVLRCSLIEMTDEGRPHVSGCYTGGVDAHRARGWHLHDNLIRGFWCANGLSEHGVHFWRGCRDTRVERNVIVDCARGIGFGLGEDGGGRVYDDEPCDGATQIGHFGGTIRNNFVAAADPSLAASNAGFDTGIALEQACEVMVAHNTVASTMTPYTSIEWRWSKTTATIANNAATHILLPRNDAVAEEITNAASLDPGLFVDVAQGDLHVAASAAALVDQGTPLAAGVADEDIDGEPRSDGAPDIGADEHDTE